MNNKEQKIDPETQKILNIFKYHLEPEEFREWWKIEMQAKLEIQKEQERLAKAEKKEWGEIKVFAKKREDK